MNKICIEVIGFTYRPCGPFPCDNDRSCGLTGCFGKEKLSFAYEELQKVLLAKYGNSISLELVSLDHEIPQWVQEIIRKEHPPLPIILLNRTVLPIGAISVPKISEFIDRELSR